MDRVQRVLDVQGFAGSGAYSVRICYSSLSGFGKPNTVIEADVKLVGSEARRKQ